jgi:hypothetical protein
MPITLSLRNDDRRPHRRREPADANPLSIYPVSDPTCGGIIAPKPSSGTRKTWNQLKSRTIIAERFDPKWLSLLSGGHVHEGKRQ